MLLLSLLLILYLPAEGGSTPISCYNDRGDAVDWFYMYKLPVRRGKHFSGEGEKYLLLEKGSEGWTDGKGSVNESTGALGRTVGQLYSHNKSTELAYILYNDQKPVTKSADGLAGVGGSRRGHTKGVVLLDKNRGFWLVHSTPHFPPVQKEGRFSYPSSGMVKGQNFICVTYPLERFQAIGEQLQINQPTVYDCDVPASFASLVPALAAVCGKYSPSVSNRSVTLTSAGGTDFISFAKGASFDDDLYHSWVAPTLQSDLLVQFWKLSTGVLPSNCSGDWKVKNVNYIQPGQSFAFKNSKDHSKWAVSPGPAGSSGSGGGWVCVGDINRNMAEEKRGGGTVCQRDPVVWKAYRTAALKWDECKGGASLRPFRP